MSRREPRLEHYLGLGPSGFHRLAYAEWGAAAGGRIVICAHGYSGQARDFDDLARALAGVRRVVCPDIAGRGDSAWLGGPLQYHFPQFLADLNALLARLGATEVDWVGTSMGGLLGMLLAGQPNSPIRRLVMNDVGAFLPMPALRKIARGLDAPAHFASLEAVEAHLRETREGWGPLTAAQWRAMARHNARPAGEGFRLHYDPAIAKSMGAMPMMPGLFFWDAWQRVQCPVLLLRGEHSEVFPRIVADSMLLRHPHARLEEVPGCAHAPSLSAKSQIGRVRGFLDGPLHWGHEDSPALAARAAQ